eukprot:gene14455-20467_t
MASPVIGPDGQPMMGYGPVDAVAAAAAAAAGMQYGSQGGGLQGATWQQPGNGMPSHGPPQKFAVTRTFGWQEKVFSSSVITAAGAQGQQRVQKELNNNTGEKVFSSSEITAAGAQEQQRVQEEQNNAIGGTGTTTGGAPGQTSNEARWKSRRNAAVGSNQGPKDTGLMVGCVFEGLVGRAWWKSRRNAAVGSNQGPKDTGLMGDQSESSVLLTYVQTDDFCYRAEVSKTGDQSEGSVLFTYVQTDSFCDREEDSKTVTTSWFEQHLPLYTRIMSNPKRRQQTLNWRPMYIMADLATEHDAPGFNEKILVQIKAFPDGSFDMRPGFNKPGMRYRFEDNAGYRFEDNAGGWRPFFLFGHTWALLASPALQYYGLIYRFEDDAGGIYEYSVENASIAEGASLDRRTAKLQKQVGLRAEELRRNALLAEFTPPPEDENSFRMHLFGEIVAVADFQHDHLYIEFVVCFDPALWELQSDWMQPEPGICKAGSPMSQSIAAARSDKKIMPAACWNRTDSLALHQFDQFTQSASGCFHPRAQEVILNSEVWGLRTYRLLRSVPGLDDTTPVFNGPGDVWDLRTYRLLRSVPGLDDTTPVFNSTGNIWDLRTYRLLRSVPGLDDTTPVFNGTGDVWDLRTYRLLRSVPGLDDTTPIFNGTGDVIYAMQRLNDGAVSNLLNSGRIRHALHSAFRTIDATSYVELATVDVERAIVDIAVETSDQREKGGERAIVDIAVEASDQRQKSAEMGVKGAIVDIAVEASDQRICLATLDQPESGEIASCVRIYESEDDVDGSLDDSLFGSASTSNDDGGDEDPMAARAGGVWRRRQVAAAGAAGGGGGDGGPDVEAPGEGGPSDGGNSSQDDGVEDDEDDSFGDGNHDWDPEDLGQLLDGMDEGDDDLGLYNDGGSEDMNSEWDGDMSDDDDDVGFNSEEYA